MEMDIQYLSECFCYDQITGNVTWRHRPIYHFKRKSNWEQFNRRYPGKNVGTKDSYGYLQVIVKSRLVLLHRIVYSINVGQIPDGMEIDHINGNKIDNRVSNLRLALKHENGRNRGKCRLNKSGALGVHYDNEMKTWVAQITAKGKRMRLGNYSNKSEAAMMYMAASLYYFGDFSPFVTGQEQIYL